MKNNKFKSDDFDELRKKWKTSITGGDELNIRDKDIRDKIDQITVEAKDIWSALNKERARSYLWENPHNEILSGCVTANYKRIREMALAFSTVGSELYVNQQLKKDVIDSLDWMYENMYNEHVQESHNWWHWEIGSPMLLNDTVKPLVWNLCI